MFSNESKRDVQAYKEKQPRWSCIAPVVVVQ